MTRGSGDEPILCPQCRAQIRVDGWVQANPLMVGALIEHTSGSQLIPRGGTLGATGPGLDRKRKRSLETHSHLSKRVRRNGGSRVYVRIEKLTVVLEGERMDLT